MARAVPGVDTVLEPSANDHPMFDDRGRSGSSSAGAACEDRLGGPVGEGPAVVGGGYADHNVEVVAQQGGGAKAAPGGDLVDA
jgi:hypothetical protein